MDEIWKNIEGYNGDYKISNLGRVKSFKRNTRILSTPINSNGYKCVTLHDGKNKTHLVHRLVACAFLEESFKHLLVNHKDGIKTNNSVSNLEWITAWGNATHAMKHNLRRTRDWDYFDKLHIKFTQFRVSSRRTVNDLEALSTELLIQVCDPRIINDKYSDIPPNELAKILLQNLLTQYLKAKP